jgi:hypothetical protein
VEQIFTLPIAIVAFFVLRTNWVKLGGAIFTLPIAL